MLPDDQIQQVADAYRNYGQNEGSRKTGIPISRFKRLLRRAVDLGLVAPMGRFGEQETAPSKKSFSIAQPPADDLSIDELLALKEKVFERKSDHSDWASLIPVEVKIPGPICLGVFGDPHIDDDGCDIRQLREDLALITGRPYMMGLNIGDLTNNWIGRLARKYADQMTTRKQVLTLMEWVIVKNQAGAARNWLAHILGNHDLWQGSDVIGLLNRGTGALDRAHGVRMQLNFPAGEPVRIHARHDFPGSSMHNPTHALKRELEHGYRDHIMVAGHRHIDGYQAFPNMAERIVSHLSRVSGYKRLDDYSDERRFIEMRMNPSVWYVIDPTETVEAERIKVFWKGEKALRYVEHLRREAGL